MYTPKATPQVLGAAVGGLGASVLPQTGVNSVVQIALALAAGLAVWALVYVVMAKFGKR